MTDLEALDMDDNAKGSKIQRQEKAAYIRGIGLLLVVLIVGGATWAAKTKRLLIDVDGGQDPVLVAAPAVTVVDIKALQHNFTVAEQSVRDIKATGVIMETDPASLKATAALQKVARELCRARYGPTEPYRVIVTLEFQDGTLPVIDTVTIETAPLEYIPYSVYNFLEVARGYHGGGFHRKAGHVLQVAVNSNVKKHLAFQEYSAKFPHVRGSTGYCGRPSGPCWYISIMDNTENHGPGSQQKENPYEADANFGKIMDPGMEKVVPRIVKAMPREGFLDNRKEWVLIKAMKIMVRNAHGEYVDWIDKENV